MPSGEVVDRDDGRALVGVVVSDGLSVTRTVLANGDAVLAVTVSGEVVAAS
jgi:hypothetical protein